MIHCSQVQGDGLFPAWLSAPWRRSFFKTAPTKLRWLDDHAQEERLSTSSDCQDADLPQWRCATTLARTGENRNSLFVQSCWIMFNPQPLNSIPHNPATRFLLLKFQALHSMTLTCSECCDMLRHVATVVASELALVQSQKIIEVRLGQFSGASNHGWRNGSRGDSHLHWRRSQRFSL